MLLGAPIDTTPNVVVRDLIRPSEFRSEAFLGNHGLLSDDDDPVAWTETASTA